MHRKQGDASESGYTMDDLLYLMARLRDPDGGCPWDLQQDARSIINYSIEEVYELADALEQGDAGSVRDELGDLLFQVVFFARLAEEEDSFDFGAVVRALCEKLLRRHPHVFADGDLYPANADSTGEAKPRTVSIDSQQVKANWEAIKQSERSEREQSGLFANVPLALPAILRAAKLQKRAAAIGLDWPDVDGAVQSLRAELGELEQEIARRANGHPAAQRQRLQEELGDVLFSCVNVARKLELNAEQALRDANGRFCQRAEYVERSLGEAGLLQGQDGVSPAPPELVDQLWQAAKKCL
ncbi:MAG: nucleoside triphosphate pyrophosphohydrolase [Pseudomonadales bacterium]